MCQQPPACDLDYIIELMERRRELSLLGSWAWWFQANMAATISSDDRRAASCATIAAWSMEARCECRGLKPLTIRLICALFGIGIGIGIGIWGMCECVVMIRLRHAKNDAATRGGNTNANGPPRQEWISRTIPSSLSSEDPPTNAIDEMG